MKNQRFRKLEVWNKSIDFIEQVYRITSNFPDAEKYGLVSQLRRAATSVALNIAEGSGSSSDKEFSRFLNISVRSSYEVMCGMEVSERLKYCSETEKNLILEKSDEISAMLTGLSKKLKSDI